MLKTLSDVKTNELRHFFGATRWKKFTLSVDGEDPHRVQELILGTRKTIVDFCRKVYVTNRRDR